LKVNVQLYNLTILTLGKVSPTHTEQKVGWAPDFVWIWWQGEKYQARPAVCSLFLSIIITDLSWFKGHEDTTQMEL